MEKRIRKIGALVVVGMFVAMLYLPGVIAPDGETVLECDGSYRIDIDNNEGEDDRIFSVSHDDGTELFRVQEDGNVGIGTASPSQALHVAGNVRITGALYDSNNQPGTSGQILQTTGSGIDWVDASTISDGDWIISGDDMYSAVSGNVGIGTTSPDNPLELLSATTPQLRITNTDATDYATFAVDTDGQLDITTIDGGGDSGHICLIPDKRVGIGTTSPTAKIHIIQTDSVDPALRVDDEASDESPFVIDRNGDVGIGSSMPFKTHKLVIIDGDSLENRAGMYVYQAGAMTGGTGYGIYIRKEGASTTNVAGFFNATGATNNYGVIVANGNVGIGTTSPEGILHIDNTGESKGHGVMLDTYHAQTEGANTATIATISTSTDEAYALTVTVIGISAGADEVGHYVRHATFKNDGGTVSAVGSISVAHNAEEDGNWAVSFMPSGTDILVQVRGNTDDTVQWQATVEKNIVED